MILKEVNDNRKIFKDMGMKKWPETRFTELKRGVRIRIYSPSGRPLETGGEETIVTLSDAFQRHRPRPANGVGKVKNGTVFVS